MFTEEEKERIQRNIENLIIAFESIRKNCPKCKNKKNEEGWTKTEITCEECTDNVAKIIKLPPNGKYKHKIGKFKDFVCIN